MREAYGLIKLMFRSPNSTNPAAQAAKDRQAYIPPDVAKAMAGHMERSMPEHLKKYQGGATYVPERVENEMTQHLEKSLPPHMKQYAGAYMQQNVVEPSLAKAGANFDVNPTAAAGPAPRPPVTAAGFRPQQNPSLNGPQESYAPAATPNQDQAVPDQPYAFITNAPAAPKQSPLAKLTGGSSPIRRVLLVLGCIIVLFIILSIVKNLVSSGPDFTPLVGIAQEQQELIHLATNAALQSDLSTSNQNFVATMQLSMTTSQTKTIKYLLINHKKVSPKVLNLKISSTIDSQLTAAAAATTYNETFQSVAQAQLATYANALKQAYQLDKGKNGRALLLNCYQQAQLLQTQLAGPGN